MANFSTNKSDGKQTAVFKKHHPHEVIKDLSPNVAGIKKTVQWSSTSSGKVLR
jgi:hypothetical protein